MIPKVQPISVDEVHVVIRCPYCGKKHWHGSNGGEDYAGHRAAHCFKDINDIGYIIQKKLDSSLDGGGKPNE